MSSSLHQWFRTHFLHQLHVSDLRSLTPHSYLFQALQEAPSSRQYPYIPHHPGFDVDTLTYDLSTKCRSHLMKFSPGDRKAVFEHAANVIHLTMPHIAESGGLRKEVMLKHCAYLC